MEKCILECVFGSLRGNKWTLREGMEYRMGRSRDADIRIPNEEKTIASDNTVFIVRDGVPYVGSRRISEGKSIGTWLNGSYLMELVADGDMEKGWFPLNNNDRISIGYGGKEMEFEVTCPDRPFSMEEMQKRLVWEIENHKGRRPWNILKNAREVDLECIEEQIKETMERGYRDENLLMKETEREFSENVYKEINKNRVRFIETEIPDESNILKQILKDVKGQNDISDDKEEILSSRMRIKEFISKASERNTEREKSKLSERKPIFASTVPKKDYKTNFHFDILEKIGKGGFSNVFLIRDSRDDELLVLKSLDVVKNVTHSQEAKYLREADLGEKLDHKNLVKTYDIRKYNGNYYMIMEYCDGGSICDLMKKFYGYLDLDEATDYFLQVLDGLDYLHNVELEQPDQNGVLHKVTGIVHRDIKPENMLIKNIDGKQVVKISDFGLSKSYELAGYSGITNGEIAGSLKYCSKRQFSDYYKYVSPQDDVFSATASYYEMITGRCVRDREKFKDINLAILSGSLVPVRVANPHIPQALADVVDSVLQEERLGSDSRFTTAKELKEKIKNALDIK